MSSPSWLVITFLILGRLVTVLKHLPSASFEIFKTIYSLFLASLSNFFTDRLEPSNRDRSFRELLRTRGY